MHTVGMFSLRMGFPLPRRVLCFSGNVCDMTVPFLRALEILWRHHSKVYCMLFSMQYFVRLQVNSKIANEEKLFVLVLLADYIRKVLNPEKHHFQCVEKASELTIVNCN